MIMDFENTFSSVLGSIDKLSNSIIKISNKIEEIEDRLDRIEKRGKYRQYGPSPYDASARR